MKLLFPPKTTAGWWNLTLVLAIATIVYNLAEGMVSVFFGVQDEALTLFGFGLDSFIELISGAGILVMVLRIRRDPEATKTPFERAALRVTGTGFYLLVGILVLTGVYNLIVGHEPESTFAGVIISCLSIGLMWALVVGKRAAGKALNSAAIIADANCALVCVYMSVALLVSSGVYTLTGFGAVDSLGAFALAYYSYKEGKEAFENAESLSDTCGCSCSCVGECHCES